MILDIQPISQLDDRWQNERLGTSYTTIGQYGCLLTCVAMLLNFYGHDTDPKRLNDALKVNNGFAGGNLLVWDAVKSVYPDVLFANRYYGNRLDKLDENLALGNPAIVKVDGDPKTYLIDDHWVLVIGKCSGKYILADPIDGALVIDRYPRFYFICTYGRNNG